MPQSFFDIKIRRPALAEQYLAALRGQPGRPLSVFAPRQVGKTSFLLDDLSPLAKENRFLVVYCDVWLCRDRPFEAINHALEEEIARLTVPRTALGKTAKQEVKKISVMGNSIELGESPSDRDLPLDPGLRFDSLIRRIHREQGRPILLLLDEFQALAESDSKLGLSVVSALRAALQTHKEAVFAVFTGSSQGDLAAMFTQARAPMYQFAQQMDFPHLGSEWPAALQAHFRAIHQGREPSLVDLDRLFSAVDYRPGILRDIVVLMSAEGLTDVDVGLEAFSRRQETVAGFKQSFGSLRLFDRAMVRVLAEGLKPMSDEAQARLASLLPANAQPSKGKARLAVERLKAQHVLLRDSPDYRFADSLFRDFVLKQHSADLL